MFLIIHQKKTRNFRNPVLGLRIFPSRGIKLLNKHKLENNSSMTLNCCEGSSNYDVIHIFRIFYRLSPCHVFKYCGFALRTWRPSWTAHVRGHSNNAWYFCAYLRLLHLTFGDTGPKTTHPHLVWRDIFFTFYLYTQKWEEQSGPSKECLAKLRWWPSKLLKHSVFFSDATPNCCDIFCEVPNLYW